MKKQNIFRDEVSTICNKRGCKEEVYGNKKQCIFHCEKSGFDRNDVAEFWRLFREKYIVANVYSLLEEVEVSNIVFPSFRNNTFSNRIDKECTFKNCIFEDIVNLSNVQNRDKIVFDNCTFFGDIQVRTSSEIEIINSTFKKELSLGTSHWKQLNIQNSKFIKDVTITTNENLSISQNSIFRGNLNVHGTGNTKLDFENSICSKKFLVQNTKEINIENIEVKSGVTFNTQNVIINIKNNTFTTDMVFNELDTLNLNNVVFEKELKFNSDMYNKISFDTVELVDMSVVSLNSLKLINTKVNGSFTQKNQCRNMIIEESTCVKDFVLANVLKLHTKNFTVLGTTSLNGLYDDVVFEEHSSFEKVSIGSTHTLNITDVSIDQSLELFGDAYESIIIQNSSILKSLIINKTSHLELKNIKSKPTVKLQHEQYPSVLISDVRFSDLEINSVNNLEMKNSIIWGELKFSNKKNGQIQLSDMKLKNKCSFPETQSLNILAKCHFAKNVSFEKTTRLILSDSVFNNEVFFVCAYGEVSLENCEFKGPVLSHEHCEFDNLSIIGSKFFDEMNMHGVTFKILSMKGFEFKEKLVLTNTKIEHLHIGHKDTENESYGNSVFWSLVDFSMSNIGDIEIINAAFLSELNFNDMEKELNLSRLREITINTLNINHSLIVDIFKNSDLISIENFNVEKSKIHTSDDSEINIDKVHIDNLKWNNLEIHNNVNMTSVEIKNFTIANLNMEHRFKIKHSAIENISFIASTFDDLQIIDNVKKTFESKLQFKNTTIKNAVLDKLNYESFTMRDAHVSEAKIGYVKFKKGSRETNRFFKNYYDSISDYIQANEYYKQEMQEQYNVTKDKSEKVILGIGKIVSDFGQSWFRPLFGIVLLTLFFLAIIHFDKISIECIINNKLRIWNGFWAFLNPFSKSVSNDYKDVYGLWMIHKLLLSVVIYHFVVAVKRKSRR